MMAITHEKKATILSARRKNVSDFCPRQQCVPRHRTGDSSHNPSGHGRVGAAHLSYHS
jgi:hypothetical protein